MKSLSFMNLPPRRMILRTVGLSIAAGLVHGFAAPSHLEEWVGYGAFFLFTATAQVCYAVYLGIEAPSRGTLWAGILGNAAIILLWLVTRTVGIPFFGPEAGEVEPIGLLDSISKLIELVLIIHLAALLRIFPQLEKRPIFE